MLGATIIPIYAQIEDLKKYDIFLDTLLIINGKPIDSERVLMTRQEIMNADTFRVNQKGLDIVGFTMTALTLGHSVELTTDKAILSQAMKNEILNKHSNFKFIYIKDINLQAKDGRLVAPSLNEIKVIFSN
jgi:hypothetical protein